MRWEEKKKMLLVYLIFTLMDMFFSPQASLG